MVWVVRVFAVLALVFFGVPTIWFFSEQIWESAINGLLCSTVIIGGWIWFEKWEQEKNV